MFSLSAVFIRFLRSCFIVIDPARLLLNQGIILLSMVPSVIPEYHSNEKLLKITMSSGMILSIFDQSVEFDKTALEYI